MRYVVWSVVLFGCGGSPPPPQTPPGPTPPPSRPTATEPQALTPEVCAQRKDEFGPVGLTEAQVSLRRGTGVTTFADLASTKETPIEVCMPDGERAWISSVTCVGGAPPAASARSGNVGAGGTCGSVIDLYIVKCPEADYEVFMDMYMCPPGKGL